MSEGKHDEGKPMPHLLYQPFLKDLAGVMSKSFRTGKYKKYSYMSCETYSELWDSAQRHLSQFWEGEDLDESGYNHLLHVAANCMMLYAIIQKGEAQDDRNINR